MADISQSSSDEVKKSAKKQAVYELEDNFYYNVEDILQHSTASKRLPDTLKMHHSFGLSTKRHNIHMLDSDTLLTAVGNVLLTLSLKSRKFNMIMGLREGSIGSIAIHPSGKFFAVGEIHRESPNIYIYEYPSLKVYRILRNGAERGFADLSFNCQGSKLASVGMSSDYMLTIWNWKQERVLLRSKAFSQDVYKVDFASEDDGILTTSGMGHIKFWRISSTFTGLKLQGIIGKFGASELSDIASFVQLPDGKVLSSTETGNLLVWDAGIIKCEVSMKDKKPCHQGRIEVVQLNEVGFITAGEDGFVRVWDFEKIDNADVVTDSDSDKTKVGAGTQSRVFELDPIDEVFVGSDVKIISLVRIPNLPNDYIIQDENGHIFHLDLDKKTTEEIFSYHAGSIVSTDTSPLLHSVATLGEDGSLRIYEYNSKKCVGNFKYCSGGTFLCYLPEGTTVAAGFSDGVIRLLTHSYVDSDAVQTSISLEHVIKPHTKGVSTIAFSPNGNFMATGSHDHTFFLFKLKCEISTHNGDPVVNFNKKSVSFIPLGFVTMDSIIQTITFSPDNHRNVDELEKNERFSRQYIDYSKLDTGSNFLILLQNGVVFRATVSYEGNYDNSVTFELNKSDLNIKQWRPIIKTAPQPIAVTSVKAETEETGNEAKENEVKETVVEKKLEDMPEDQRESVVRRRNGLTLTADSDFTNIMYLEGGYLLGSLINSDGEGEVRVFKLENPEVSRLLLVHRSPFSQIRFSRSMRYLLAGANDGVLCVKEISVANMILNKWENGHETYESYSNQINIEIQNARLANDLQYGAIESAKKSIRTSSQFWMGYSHDCMDSKVTAFQSSFDDAYFVSSGQDGSLFIWRCTELEPRKNLILEDDLFGAIGNQESLVQDISDPSSYSIQEVKIKSERDRELEEAEKKKMNTRNYVHDLRNEYLRLVNESERYTNSKKLEKLALSVDPTLKDDIEKETTEKIDNLKKELAWISAKETLATKKLAQKFLDCISTERIEVCAIKTDLLIASFRTRKLPHIHEAAEANHDAVVEKQQKGTSAASRTNSVAKPSDSRKSIRKQSFNSNAARTSFATAAANKLEARKAERNSRMTIYKELMKTKPDNKYEDPRDVAAINYAQNNMGDYKLKTSDDYIVPENERVDTEKKKRQINLLTEGVHMLKEQKQFNQQVLKLRNFKRSLIESIHKKNEKIKEINKELNIVDDSIWEPVMGKVCYPEQRNIVTANDLLQLQQEDARNAARKGDDPMGFGNGMNAAAKNATDVQTIDTSSSGPISLSMTATSEEELLQESRSQLERKEIENKNKELNYQKRKLLQSIQDDVNNFDEILEQLFKEKSLLEADLKFADIKLLVLYREWIHLKEFEKFDNALAEKLKGKQREKFEIEEKIQDCQEKANYKKVTMEAILNREKDIHADFLAIMETGNKHESYLTKVFKRKVKKSKKKAKADENEEDTEESEESEDEDYDSNEDDVEEEVYEEKCPADFDPSLWERILDLRDQKLEEEEKIAEIQKAVDLLKKEIDSLLKKEKIIDAGLKNAENEIQEFQTQKQRKLNELNVVVPLRLHQIQNLVKNQIPSDLSSSLVFTNQGLLKLKARIKEIEQERISVKKHHKELRSNHVILNKSKKEKQEKMTELNAKAQEVQMLKFGRLVDLEKLEKIGINRNAEEFREKMAREDAKKLQEVFKMEAQISSLKQELTRCIKENTNRLEALGDLTESKKRLEDALNNNQANVAAEYSGPHKKEVLERDRLLRLVQTQGAEIEALKNEIEMLVRKPIDPSRLPVKRPKARSAAPAMDPFSAPHGPDGLIEFSTETN